MELSPHMDSLLRANQSTNNEVMLLSIYFTLGVFLLIAARNPSANRSLIAFTAWSSFAHAAVLAVMAFQKTDERREPLIAVALLVIIGVILIVLTPRPSSARASAAVAWFQGADLTRCSAGDLVSSTMLSKRQNAILPALSGFISLFFNSATFWLQY